MKRSQLKPENLDLWSGGTPVSWIWAFLGVPSDGENRVGYTRSSLGHSCRWLIEDRAL